MFRMGEVVTFSIFFVLSFIKLFSVGLVDINIVTYLYYFIVLLFLARYYARSKIFRINYLLGALMLSLVWLVIVGLFQVQFDVFVYSKLRALFVSVLSIPIAVYMFRRNLLKPAVIVTTISILLLTVIFYVYGTYDETQPAYVLNELYLHGGFLAGFMIFLCLLLRLPIILPVVLIICLITLGARGPSLSLMLVSMFLLINVGFTLVKRLKLKKRSMVFFLGFLPLLFLSILPSLLDRMIARWTVIFSMSDGGDSAARRVEHIYTSVAAIQSSPAVGVGFANYGLFMAGYHDDSHPHNFVLEVLAENGLLGSLPFLVCVGLIFIKSIGNKVWPLLLYVLICLLMSYSYASSNELYFALTLAIIFTQFEKIKNENTRNYYGSSL